MTDEEDSRNAGIVLEMALSRFDVTALELVETTTIEEILETVVAVPKMLKRLLAPQISEASPAHGV